MSSTLTSFLDLPSELRLLALDAFLEDHRRATRARQPSSNHLRLLRICKEIYHEAHDLLWQYVSLRSEWEIGEFISRAGARNASHIRWVDVANDGRMLRDSETGKVIPLSKLHVALRMMSDVVRLRMFESQYGFAPLNFSENRKAKIVINFEKAMLFGNHKPPKLSTYELFVAPDSRVNVFSILEANSLSNLQLSGDCNLPDKFHPALLRHTVLRNVTGSYFDRHSVSALQVAHLRSFTFVREHNLEFEIRDADLLALVSGPGHDLRELTLLGCKYLTTGAIARCLTKLPHLEYFALSFIVTDELDVNFIDMLSPSLHTFKLKLFNTWYSVPFPLKEQVLYNTIEARLILRKPPPISVCVDIRTKQMEMGDRWRRWERLCKYSGISFSTETWDISEVDRFC